MHKLGRFIIGKTKNFFLKRNRFLIRQKQWPYKRARVHHALFYSLSLSSVHTLSLSSACILSLFLPQQLFQSISFSLTLSLSICLSQFISLSLPPLSLFLSLRTCNYAGRIEFCQSNYSVVSQSLELLLVTCVIRLAGEPVFFSSNLNSQCQVNKLFFILQSIFLLQSNI